MLSYMNTNWTPSIQLAGLHRDLESLFGRVFGGAAVRAQSLNVFTPAADVMRDGEQWLVSLAVPGIAPDKIELTTVGRTLLVRGERMRGETRESAEPILSEIPYGRFEREFTLPEEIDPRHVQASYTNGMLDLVLPLKEAARPRRIEVKTTADAKQLQAA